MKIEQALLARSSRRTISITIKGASVIGFSICLSEGPKEPERFLRGPREALNVHQSLCKRENEGGCRPPNLLIKKKKKADSNFIYKYHIALIESAYK